MFILFDIFYKISRKLISGKLLSIIKTLLGRKTFFNSKEHLLGIINYYCNGDLDIENKVILELGSGMQYSTAEEFLKMGAKEVLLVDPMFENTIILPNNKNIKIFSNLNDTMLDLYFDRIDFVFAHTVMEHISNLDECFFRIKSLLTKSGILKSRVDLSDHTLHGLERVYSNISNKHCIDYLAYSSKAWDIIGDDKCYMNRTLFPEYVALFKKNGFSIIDVQKKYFQGSVTISEDLIKIKDYNDKKDYNIREFSFIASI